MKKEAKRIIVIEEKGNKKYSCPTCHESVVLKDSNGTVCRHCGQLINIYKEDK